jgi:hypothetical protein
MRVLQQTWTTPTHDFSLEGWASVVLRDTNGHPWAWVTTKDRNFHHLEIWSGSWRSHAVFDDLEVAKTIGRIAALAAMTKEGS